MEAGDLLAAQQEVAVAREGLVRERLREDVRGHVVRRAVAHVHDEALVKVPHVGDPAFEVLAWCAP